MSTAEHKDDGPAKEPNANDGADAAKEASGNIRRQAIATAYYTRAFSMPDLLRSRAQSAYGIATTIAIVLLVGGVLTGIEDRPLWFRIGGLLVSGLWIVATWLFVRAVATPFTDPKEGQGLTGDEWIRYVPQQSLAEREEVRSRQRLAARAAAVALIATVALVAAAIIPGASATRPATVLLSKRGLRILSAFCGPTKRGVLNVRVRVRTLNDNFIKVVVPESRCRGRDRELRLHHDVILGLRID